VRIISIKYSEDISIKVFSEDYHYESGIYCWLDIHKAYMYC
jgi:DUF971 family protein